MKIGFYKLGLQNPSTKTIFKGMYDSFFEAIEKQRHKAHYITDIYAINTMDVLVVPIGDGQDREAAKVMSRFNGKVILYAQPANNWFRKSFLERWKDKILFVYNTDCSSYSKKMYDSICIKYIHLPFGSDEKIFKPLSTSKIYDVIFVANSSSGMGRHKYISKLIIEAKKRNWKVLLIGKGWEKYGFPFQLVAHGELLNVIYNSAKICINLSNNEQKLGESICLDANNRLFDLAMAGCFQVSNAAQVTEKYFSQNEVVAVDNADDWIKKISYYLKDEDKRKEICERAVLCAKSRHTWDIRAECFLKMVNMPKEDYGIEEISFIQKLYKIIDCYLPPFYWIKKLYKFAINKILK